VQQNRDATVSTEVKSSLRNKWETAIRCLEVALHPNTSDDELIAAVNGYRRTANGTPLREVCIELAGQRFDGRGTVARPEEGTKDFDRLDQENLDQRHDAERKVRELGEELLAAQQRANLAEQRLVELRSTLHDLSDENLDLRRSLERAKGTAEERQAQPAAAPFQKFLDAAIALDRGREAGSSPIFSPSPSRPWTA
jgi:hypothetical protein